MSYGIPKDICDELRAAGAVVLEQDASVVGREVARARFWDLERVVDELGPRRS